MTITDIYKNAVTLGKENDELTVYDAADGSHFEIESVDFDTPFLVDIEIDTNNEDII